MRCVCNVSARKRLSRQRRHPPAPLPTNSRFSCAHPCDSLRGGEKLEGLRWQWISGHNLCASEGLKAGDNRKRAGADHWVLLTMSPVATPPHAPKEDGQLQEPTT